MRLSLSLFLAALTGLTACTKEPRPVRLDFIGSSRFTSSDRTAGPGDTLSSRLYASVDTTSELALTHFRVTVRYEPTPVPQVYATPALPLRNVPGDSLVYLDSTFTAAAARRQLVYQNSFGTRTTSGRERWEFTVSDGNNMSTRTFRVRVINRDSTADYHQYTLRIPTAPARPARPFVALLPGLALPASAIRASAPGRQLIDLVYRPGATSLVVYENPDRTARAVLRRTALDSVAFVRLATPTLIAGAFTQAAAPAPSTGVLARNDVIAFRTVDNHVGVFTVRRLALTPYPVLELLVRVLKTPG
ncbi:hypothetical protein [uncultured Hymenobacter sp.]|uniref:hypothetical protein n=1 Tax=uncultured Hymenobacter sp. TaxID=170016 RepID=UPI0035C96C30